MRWHGALGESQATASSEAGYADYGDALGGPFQASLRLTPGFLRRYFNIPFPGHVEALSGGAAGDPGSGWSLAEA